MDQTILAHINAICAQLTDLPLDDKVELLNQLRTKLHEISPFKDEPVDLVLWVKNSCVTANSYNPNSVASSEMQLLEDSIAEDGYTQPIVTYPLPVENQDELPTTERPREVVDGFHRNRVSKESKAVRKRLHGYSPVTQIKGDRTNIGHRMSATVRHNRARGKHAVALMSDLVEKYARLGWKDIDIANVLGMEAEEVLRLKQMTGVAGLFKDQPYSHAWEPYRGEESTT